MIWILFFLLIAALSIEIYLEHRFNKELSHIKILIWVWMTMFYRLADERKLGEKGYLSFIKNMYRHDYDYLDSRDFNERWKVICNSLNLPTTYNLKDKYLVDLNDSTLAIIASKLYSNRLLFPHNLDNKFQADTVNQFISKIFK